MMTIQSNKTADSDKTERIQWKNLVPFANHIFLDAVTDGLPGQ